MIILSWLNKEEADITVSSNKIFRFEFLDNAK